MAGFFQREIVGKGMFLLIANPVHLNREPLVYQHLGPGLKPGSYPSLIKYSRRYKILKRRKGTRYLFDKESKMPRPYIIRSEIHPYHVTNRCNNKEFFPLPLSEVWNIMLRELHRMHQEHKLAIHAFVLMGNHFHLLCQTPEGNLDQVMQKFLRSTSIIISRRAKSLNHLWGGRYKWSMIESQTHYYQVYRYIYQNPVRAKLVTKVQDYSFSSLKNVPFPMHSFIPMSFGGEEGEIIWLNEKYHKEDEELIKLGLRKHQFDVNKRKLKAFNKLSLPSREPLD